MTERLPSYKVIADVVVSPVDDIVVQVTGDMYKGSISSGNKYVTASEAGGEASIADFVFDTDSNGEPGDGESTMTVHNHDMTIRTTRDDAPEGSEGPYDADIDINSADDVWINAYDQIEITAENDNIDITALAASVFITTGGYRDEDGDTWEFGTDGSLTFPDNTVQTTAYTGGEETSFTVVGGTLGDAPTFTGDPLFTGSYVRTGPMVHFRIDVDMDNITDFGSGQYYLDLPFPAKYNYLFRNACLHDVSMPRQYGLSGHVEAGESRMLLFYTDTSGQDYAFDYNSPALLTVNDNFHISGDYIADPE
jgi:hypothetical protein